MPAAWGAAAEVPKNVDPNPPLPVTETPSTATASGLVRPSFVGPQLLNGSASSRPGSSTSIAPSETTPRPASELLTTLLHRVL